jgi:hypothetical protein
MVGNLNRDACICLGSARLVSDVGGVDIKDHSEQRVETTDVLELTRSGSMTGSKYLHKVQFSTVRTVQVHVHDCTPSTVQALYSRVGEASRRARMPYTYPWLHEAPCWPCCEVTHEHIVKLARELSKQLIREYNSTRYSVHGLFGIFANGDAIDYTIPGRSRNPGEAPYYTNYNHAKTRFMFSRLCALSRQRTVNTVCEIGFNAGLSALLLLESARSARVLSYDLGNFRWARRADELVRQAYGPSRFPGVAFGNSTAILREQRRRDPTFATSPSSMATRRSAVAWSISRRCAASPGPARASFSTKSLACAA